MPQHALPAAEDDTDPVAEGPRADIQRHLEQYVRSRRAAGETFDTLEVSTGTWLALGRPEIAAGVRVSPVGPQTDLPE